MTAEPYYQISSSKVCLVDVCGTLYNETTTAGFVRFIIRENYTKRPIRYRILEILRRKPFREFVITFGKLIGRDLFRDGYIGVLKGYSRDTLRNCAKRYAAYLDASRSIAQTFARLKAAEKLGWQPLLVSNSLDIVVEAIGTQLALPSCASTLTWDKEICTGRFDRDLKYNKLQAVKEFLGTDFNNTSFMVITDNKSDQDLISVSKPVVLVTKGSERSWMRGKYDELISH